MSSYDLSKGEFPPVITGGDAGSFAKYTLDSRFPHIIDEIISLNELDSTTINALHALKKEVKEGEVAVLAANETEDSESWQECVAPYAGRRWYEIPFLSAELYFYRRILQATNDLSNSSAVRFDPFKTKKEGSLFDAGALMQRHGRMLHKASLSPGCELEALSGFVTDTIWSNRNDLSQIPGDIVSVDAEGEADLSEFLLVDELSPALKLITGRGRLGRIDILLDNCGHELLADLALACYLLQAECAGKVFLHCKKYPIFVSDATIADVEYTMDYLTSREEADTVRWGEVLKSFVMAGRLILSDASFWSLPIPFREMPEDIASAFRASDLVILKGDANYRRLVDDRYWDHDEPLGRVINYFPVNCLILRVLKSEVLVGFARAQQRSDVLGKNWLTEGKYGVIQFYQPTEE